MAQASCKPPTSTKPPWGGFEDYISQDYSSTYASAYITMGRPAQAKPIRPQAQHPWTSDAPFDTRSTAQDAFMDLHGGPRQSCKPKAEYAPVAWNITPTTTNQTSFMPYYGVPKREAFRPARKPVDGSTFDTRSTQQDSYAAVPMSYRPRKPIYPVEQKREDSTFNHTSTSRDSYPAHLVRPYVPALKPAPSMTDGMS